VVSNGGEAVGGAALPHVVVVGGGFAGLNATRALRDAPVRITVVDQHNHHLFQPLLYQVATASLSPADIAAPIRSVLRRQENVRVLLDRVTGIDPETRTVQLDASPPLEWDYLVLATGSTHSYFGHPEWEQYARGLKDLDDAVAIRNEVLTAFEVAERAVSDEERRRLLTFVIIGGGPTGVELAGAIAEIARHSLAREFHAIDPGQAAIELIEGAPRLLMTFPESLATKAQETLEARGVKVRTNVMVTGIDATGVTLATGERIEAGTRLWAAGVAASDLGRRSGLPLDRVGRVLVGPDLTVAGRPDIFVAGDLAALNGPKGKQYPGVAQVAIQQGKSVGANIKRRLAGEETKPFHYFDRGNMATIGRNNAIAEIWRFRISGFIAWLVWLFIHITYLIGFRNRFLVLTQWAWSYFTYHRTARLITGGDES